MTCLVEEGFNHSNLKQESTLMCTVKVKPVSEADRVGGHMCDEVIRTDLEAVLTPALTSAQRHRRLLNPQTGLI